VRRAAAARACAFGNSAYNRRSSASNFMLIMWMVMPSIWHVWPELSTSDSHFLNHKSSPRRCPDGLASHASAHARRRSRRQGANGTQLAEREPAKVFNDLPKGEDDPFAEMESPAIQGSLIS
jgi:hypothetical protein